MTAARDRVALGVVGRPHGVRGLVRIRPYTARPGDVAAYGPVALADGRRFAVEVVAEAKGWVTARLEGIEDRDAAAALAGQELFVPRGALPAPAPGEYYLHDLIGLRAAGADGTEMGRVVAVHDFGAGPILEIGPGKDDAGATVMVPFTDAAVPEVDLDGGRLVVEAPPELLNGNVPSRGRREDEDG